MIIVSAALRMRYIKCIIGILLLYNTIARAKDLVFRF